MNAEPRKPSARAGRPKDQRLYVRISQDEKLLVEAAARAEGTTVSDFIVREAVNAAELAISSEAAIVMSDEDWDWFTRRLEEPPRVIPELKRLFERKPVWDE
jgi:uncharacterized protein (DUF1778 family)